MNLEGLSLEDTVQRSTPIKANEGAMTEAQEQHLEDVEDRFCLRLDEKYRAGQLEHGGNVWAKPGIMRQMTNEVLDLTVYRDVMEQQLRAILTLLDKNELVAARNQLADLLEGALD